MPPSPLLIVGSMAIDHVITPPTTRSGLLGGSAVYCSYAASYFTALRLVSIVGNDWPVEYMNLLASRSIDLAGLQVDAERPTFRWSGQYAEDMNDRQTIDLQLNAYEKFEPSIPSSFKSTPFVFLANAIPAIQLQVLDQLVQTKLVVADTHEDWFEQHHTDLLKVLRRIDGLALSESEATALTGESEPLAAGERILEMGPRFVIVKQGTGGSTFVSAESNFQIPAYQPPVTVDPTGAGDAFAGGFIGWLAASGETSAAAMKEAIAVGTVIASFVVEDFSLDRLRRLETLELTERLAEYHSRAGSPTGGVK